MRTFKSQVRSMIERAGYHVIAKSFFGIDPFADFKTLLAGRPAPCVIDVGGFVGEFVLAVTQVAPAARVHSFEPNLESHRCLVFGTQHLPNVTPRHLALGNLRGELEFRANAGPATSSFLPVPPLQSR
jgi:hypothetical protein